MNDRPKDTYKMADIPLPQFCIDAAAAVNVSNSQVAAAVSEEPHTDVISDMTEWQELARPEPTAADFNVIVGVHIEEFAEMLDALKFDFLGYEGLRAAIGRLARELKSNTIKTSARDRKGLLDALCDQVVTASGIAHAASLPLRKGLVEVNRANWSKFVDGKPIFDKNGKIAKGPNYVAPDLEKYASVQG